MINNDIFTKSELSQTAYREILPIFFNEVKEDFFLITEALKVQNNQKILTLTHKIKGSAFSYCAVAIANKAIELELKTMKNETIGTEVKQLGNAIEISLDFAKENFNL